MKLSGIPIDSKFYLFGNATTGRELFRRSGTAGFGAPTRSCVLQREDEETDIDLPTSFFGQFPELGGSPGPAQLDVRMIPLLQRVAG